MATLTPDGFSNGGNKSWTYRHQRIKLAQWHQLGGDGRGGWRWGEVNTMGWVCMVPVVHHRTGWPTHQAIRKWKWFTLIDFVLMEKIELLLSFQIDFAVRTCSFFVCDSAGLADLWLCRGCLDSNCKLSRTFCLATADKVNSNNFRKFLQNKKVIYKTLETLYFYFDDGW